MHEEANVSASGTAMIAAPLTGAQDPVTTQTLTYRHGDVELRG